MKEIIETVVAETGKARTDAMSMEVFSVADALCYYAKNAEKFLKPEQIDDVDIAAIKKIYSK